MQYASHVYRQCFSESFAGVGGSRKFLRIARSLMRVQNPTHKEIQHKELSAPKTPHLSEILYAWAFSCFEGRGGPKHKNLQGQGPGV